jgi:hypothetical protein
MQIEHPNDFFRRDTAMLFHQLNDPDMIWLRSLCVFGLGIGYAPA